MTLDLLRVHHYVNRTVVERDDPQSAINQLFPWRIKKGYNRMEENQNDMTHQDEIETSGKWKDIT